MLQIASMFICSIYIATQLHVLCMYRNSKVTDALSKSVLSEGSKLGPNASLELRFAYVKGGENTLSISYKAENEHSTTATHTLTVAYGKAPALIGAYMQKDGFQFGLYFDAPTNKADEKGETLASGNFKIEKLNFFL